MDEPSAGHDPLDLPYVRDVLAQLFIPVSDGYFRPRLLGASRLPPDGPIILACNHSGTAFPYDAIVLDIALWRRDNCEPARKFRSMFAKELAQTWWMRPYGIDNFWRRAGGVDQTFDNFDRLLARGDRVIYYPEGVPGIGKGFQHRYQLQPFRTSFVVLSARNNAPVYPVYIVNGEWVMPFNFTWRPLDRLMQICFKVPFLPLPLGAFLPLLLPFTWYLAFPARLVMIVGKPIDMAARLRRRGVEDFSVVDREVAREAAEQLRGEMQEQLTRYVQRYGRWPYNCRLLGRRLAKARGKLWRTLPLGWAVVARAHDRNRRRPPARGWLHAVLRDWDLVGFYVPVFGWLILGLARRFRRPPCGFRGLSAEARREQDGGFRWSLSERPLPPRDAVFGPTLRPATTPAASTGGRAVASPGS